MTTPHALRLAGWVAHHYGLASVEPLTQLKLQKLCFYAYGVAAAHDVEAALGEIHFEAWKHGPVLRPLWEKLTHYGAKPIDRSELEATSFSAASEAVLQDALDVYGVLDAWSIREESHLEAPWIEAHGADVLPIASEAIKQHFKEKFSGGVVPPAHLFDRGNLSLDGIPSELSFESFASLAAFVRESVHPVLLRA